MNNNNAIIFQALDVILDKREQRLEYNKIDNAIIAAITNPTNGTYQIEFNGNKISATAISTNDIYAIGDSVLISYVNNQLTNGTVQILKRLKGAEEKNAISYVPFGPNWFSTFFTLETDQTVSQNPKYAEIFKNYVDTCNYIKLSADFKPFLLKSSTEYKFNYGIQIIFELEDGTMAEYFLDSEYFQGNIYTNSCKTQEVILNTPNNIKTLSQVNFYIVNPEDDNGKIDINKGEKIFITNCNITFLKQVEQQNNLYYLNVRALDGVYFTPETNELKLEASLMCGSDQTTVSEDNLIFTWYKQKGYNWELLIDQTSSALTVLDKDVQIRNIFKVRVQLDNGISLEEEIELFNFKEKLELNLILQNEILSINNIEYTGLWQVEYSDSKEIISTEKTNSLNITDYIGYDWVKFYCCNLVGPDEKEIDITLTYSLVAAASETDLQVSFNGEHKYTYDEQGNIAFAESEIYKVLSYKTLWADGTINKIKTIKWLINNESIGGQPMTPINSMLQNVWVDSDNFVHYQIKNKYNNSYTNNSLILSITLINNKQYTFVKQIEFNKIGVASVGEDSWLCVIRPVDKDTDTAPAPGLKYLYENNSIILKAFVYNNGQLVENNFKYSWELSGDLLPYGDYSLSSNVLQVINSNLSMTNIPWVKVKILINDNKYLYAYYGINYSSAKLEAILENNLPKEIEYDKGYLSNKIYCLYDKNEVSLELIKNNIPVSLTNDHRINIDSSYSGSQNPFFVIKLPIALDVNLFWPVFIKINSAAASQIQGWDGNQLQINENDIIEMPQVGAGTLTKDTLDKDVFNGIVMGTENKSGDKFYGLYGYQNGEQTFSLKENGSATFGKNGQLKIDDKGILYAGGWTLEKNEMYSKDKSTRLHSEDGIFTEELTITEEQEDKQVILGKIGKIKGFDGQNVTTTVGLSTRDLVDKQEDENEEVKNYSIVLESGQHIRLSVAEGCHIYFQCAPENQHGIYARFA